LLPADERSRLVDVLLDSLREGELAEIESAWAIEIERGVKSYERGEATLVPAEEVFAKARVIAGA
jgi:putative addiction module component (TIGR02574 family)